MDQGTSVAPDQIFGFDVYDDGDNKIGSVDNVWIDDATNALEFVGVKTGWIFGKIHIIPTQNAQIGDGQISFPYPESQIKDAPTFPADHELSPGEEEEVYSYYGINRSMSESSTGLGEGLTGAPAMATTTGDATDTAETPQVTLAEEQLQVGKQEVEAGNVRLRKVVRTEHEEVPVDLEREQVSVERVSPDQTDVPTNAFQEQEIEVPVTREEPVVAKEAVATGGVRLNKESQTETRTVGADVRKEDVEIDRNVDTNTPPMDTPTS
jgi:uncharacterized protein (TIGR02271 family)